jgi:hypothetical protein
MRCFSLTLFFVNRVLKYWLEMLQDALEVQDLDELKDTFQVLTTLLLRLCKLPHQHS